MPRDFKRTDRIADVMQRELSQIIQKEMKDPRISMVTIAEIKISKDLSFAKVYVSVMFEEKAEETMRTLNSAAKFLRSELAKKIQMRTMPQLTFVYDDTTIKANRISKLIDEAIKQDNPAKKDDEHEG
jgi:ribosome-binding factor A